MQEKSAASRKCRVVIADDNRDAGDSLALLMQLEGHDVTVVTDGASAVRAIENGLPDVVVLDIGMPHLNGYEVARQVRAQRLKTITLIAVTGWGAEADKVKAFDAGFDYHFTKPVEPDELCALLRRLPHD